MPELWRFLVALWHLPWRYHSSAPAEITVNVTFAAWCMAKTELLFHTQVIIIPLKIALLMVIYQENFSTISQLSWQLKQFINTVLMCSFQLNNVYVEEENDVFANLQMMLESWCKKHYHYTARRTSEKKAQFWNMLYLESSNTGK